MANPVSYKLISLAKPVNDEAVGTVKDSAGRTGLEPAFHKGVGTAEVIIDPKSSTLLGLREPWRSEKNQRQATYLSVGLTDTIG